MKTNTTRAATHAWWVSSLPELDDLCPLQLILGQGRLSVGAADPTSQQKAILAEPWNKRYARLLDVQTAHGQEVTGLAEMTKNEAASVAWEEEFHKAAMEYRAASIAATPAAYANLLRLAQAAPPAAPVQGDALTPEWIWNWLMDYCKRRNVSPATHDSLFQMVPDARKLLAAPAAPASEQDDWRSAVRAACSHLDYPIDAPQRVQDALRALKNSMVDTTPATGESGADYCTEENCRHFSGGNRELPSEIMARIGAASAQQDECMRSHPHENMSAACAAKTIEARAMNQAAQQDEREARAFEDWLARVCPSGDCEAVQRQWEESSDYADLHDDQQVQAGGEDKWDTSSVGDLIRYVRMIGTVAIHCGKEAILRDSVIDMIERFRDGYSPFAALSRTQPQPPTGDREGGAS